MSDNFQEAKNLLNAIKFAMQHDLEMPSPGSPEDFKLGILTKIQDDLDEFGYASLRFDSHEEEIRLWIVEKFSPTYGVMLREHEGELEVHITDGEDGKARLVKRLIRTMANAQKNIDNYTELKNMLLAPVKSKE